MPLAALAIQQTMEIHTMHAPVAMIMQQPYLFIMHRKDETSVEYMECGPQSSWLVGAFASFCPVTHNE
jgi:hypothetical protein